MDFLLGISNFYETWIKVFCLHLVTNSTHDEEFEVQIRNLLTWSWRFESKLNQISFISTRTWLTKELMRG
jgi:hypothetical protein